MPFALYPSVLWYMPDIFEEIGLTEPPHKYGEKYKMPDGTEVDWDYDTVREIAMLLTVDAKGRDATRPGVRPRPTSSSTASSRSATTSVVSARTSAPATSTAATARRPRSRAWEAAWKWVYDGIWTDHFIMTEQVFDSDAIAAGDQAFFSGKVAMSTNFLWITYGLGPTTARPEATGTSPPSRRTTASRRRP